MNDQRLSSDPFIRRAMVTATIVAAVIALGGGLFLLLAGGDAAAHTVAIGLIAPLDDNRLSPAMAECPVEGAAPSPLPASDFDGSTGTPDRTAFGNGQIVAYNLRVAANDDVVEAARFAVTFSNAFPGRVECAFLSSDDPATTLAAPEAVEVLWRPLSGPSARGQLDVIGLRSGDQVVAQLWVVLDGTDPNMGVTVSPLVGTDAAPVRRTDRANVGLAATAQGLPSVTIEDGAVEASLGESFPSRYQIVNGVDAVVSDVTLTGSIDEGASVTGVRVIDEVGHETDCGVEDGRVECSLGFMNPGEIVNVGVTLTIDPDASSFWGRTGGACQSDGEQDLCQRAVVSWRSAFGTASVETTEVTNIDDLVLFSVLAIPVTETAYLRGSLNVDIYVTTDGARAQLNEVSTTGCPEATYIEGDTELGTTARDATFVTDADGVLDPGEVWHFTCAARQYDDGIVVVAVGGQSDTVTGRTTTEFTVAVIDPVLEVLRSNGTEVNWTVTNAGTVPLANVTMGATGCRPERIGEGDDLLDVDESWTFVCPAGAGTGFAFAVDPLGNALSLSDGTDGT